MTKTYFVYTHHRADNGAVFYVGCATKQHGRGHRKHFYRAYDFRARTPAWFAVAGAAGGVTVTLVLETPDHDEAFALERELIAAFGRRDLSLGWLVNQTDGGAGAGGQIGTPESRRKKAISKLGSLNPMWGKPSRLAQRVIDEATGEVFPSITAAAKARGFSSMQVLHNQLTGHRPNNSTLRLMV